MARAVGLDIGSRACKVAVLKGGPKGARLVRWVEREYELGEAGVLTPAAVLDTLRKALAEAKAPKDAVSLAVPAEQCVLREISVPFTEDDQIKKVAKFEFEPHLHAAAIEDVVIDWVKTGAARTGTRLLVFAAAKSMLRTRLEQLAEVGVDPLHLDVDVAALFNVAHHAKVFEEHPNCLLIDVGARTTKTLLVQGGRVKVARSIRLGAQSPLQHLEGAFEGDAEAARRAMEDAAGVEALARAPADQPSTVEIVSSVRAIEAAAAGAQQEEFVTRVLRETQRTLPVLGEEQAITRIFVSGGGAQRTHVRERLAAHYAVPVEDLPVLRAVAHRLPPSEADRCAAAGAVAVGTALKVLGMDAGEVDLRRDEFRYARTFDQVKVALATGVTLVFFALFLVLATQFLRRGQVRDERIKLQAEVEKQLRVEVFEDYEKTVPEAKRERSPSTDPTLYFQRTRARLTEVRNHLKNELGLATEVPPIRSCLETWSRVMASLRAIRPEQGKPPRAEPGKPRQIEYLLVKEEKYTQDKAEITVVVGDIPDIDSVTAVLAKNTDLFEEGGVNAKQPQRDPKTGRYTVTIECKMLEREAGEEPTAALPEAGEEPATGKAPEPAQPAPAPGPVEGPAAGNPEGAK